MISKTNKIGRRAFLVGIGGLSTAGIIHHGYSSRKKADSSQFLATNNNINHAQSLRKLAAAKGILYGGYPQRSYTDFPRDTKFQKVFMEDYELIVGGFFGVTVGPYGPNNYKFTETDPFFHFAQQNNLLFRGHPMIWNQFNSPWVVEKFKDASTTNAEIENLLINIITTLGQKYAGHVDSWDVVNEVINVEDGHPEGLRDTSISGTHDEKYPTWLNFLGPEYIELAFHVAKAADPDAKLVINETALTYSNNFGNSYWEYRREAFLKLLDKLQAKNTPIDAVGIQSHLLAHFNQDFDGNKFRRFLSDIASMGYKIIISELDVSDNKLPQNIQARDRIVAEAYYEYLSVVLDEPAVNTVISWGLHDRHTWLSDFAPRQDGASVRPLLRDQQYSKKLAWNAVVQALKEAPSR